MAVLENVLDKTFSAGFLSNRNILTRSLSLKSRLDIRIQRAVVYEALNGFVITKDKEKNASFG